MNAERAKYILFEGMDLAGKTSTARSFVVRQKEEWRIQKKSIVNVENPIRLLADSIDRVDEYGAEVLGNLYVVALMADIEKFRWPSVNTVQDSTIILRSLAFHTVYQTPRISKVLLDMMPRHPRFDTSFIFTADLETRLERLRLRAAEGNERITQRDLAIVREPEKFLAMEAVMIDVGRRFFGSVIVDTTSLTPDAVVGRVESIIDIEG